jgi:hypothetical protein
MTGTRPRRESHRGCHALADDPPPRIEGRWRLTEMTQWDVDAMDLLGPAFIEFVGDGGVLRFIAIDGTLGCRHGRRNGRSHVAFTWEGTDECDAVRGRGWATLRKDGCLTGRVFIEHGDDSGFIAEPLNDDEEHGDADEDAAHRRRWCAPLRRGRS